MRTPAGLEGGDLETVLYLGEDSKVFTTRPLCEAEGPGAEEETARRRLQWREEGVLELEELRRHAVPPLLRGTLWNIDNLYFVSDLTYLNCLF